MCEGSYWVNRPFIFITPLEKNEKPSCAERRKWCLGDDLAAKPCSLCVAVSSVETPWGEEMYLDKPTVGTQGGCEEAELGVFPSLWSMPWAEVEKECCSFYKSKFSARFPWSWLLQICLINGSSPWWKSCGFLADLLCLHLTNHLKVKVEIKSSCWA